MRVAIVHYHFEPGGVTRVVENAVRSLHGEEVEITCISGEHYDGSVLNARTVDSLGYLMGAEGLTAEKLADHLEQEAHGALGGAPDVWHIHNHCLGKNVLFHDVVAILAERQHRLLLQIHDFAEDGRPGNYQLLINAGRERLYPLAKHVHYAFPNGRDRGLLMDAGIPGERLHFLPNAVAVPHFDGADRRAVLKKLHAQKLFVYPTRAIRRKNLGEMLLWSAVADKHTVFASTLGPANPQWKPVHDRWMQFAKQHRLPARFDLVSNGFDFGELMLSADAILTTSVAEGFGLAFLEPYLINQPLAGRDLPDITRDFADEGVNLGNLYDRLPVPLKIIGAGVLREVLGKALKTYYIAYGKMLPGDAVDHAFDAITEGDTVDFGALDEHHQEMVIHEAARKKSIIPDLLRTDADCIADNHRIVAQRYSKAGYGKRLMELYTALAAAPRTQVDYLDAENVLRQFLDPARFRLLRS